MAPREPPKKRILAGRAWIGGVDRVGPPARAGTSPDARGPRGRLRRDKPAVTPQPRVHRPWASAATALRAQGYAHVNRRAPRGRASRAQRIRCAQGDEED